MTSMVEISKTFLSHSSRDKPAVEVIKGLLERGDTERRLRPIPCWFDADDLQSTGTWVSQLEQAIATCGAAVFFYGPGGLGPVHKGEIELLWKRWQCEKNQESLRIICVLLPGAEENAIQGFPSLHVLVDFRKGLDDADALTRLRELILDEASAFVRSDTPLPLKGNPYSFSDLYRVAALESDRFCGRQTELAILDATLHNSLDVQIDNRNVKILLLHAFGGVGKTALVKKWQQTVEQHDWEGLQQGFGYSFYGQGQVEKIENANDFLTKALIHFGDEFPTKGSPPLRVSRLVNLVCQRNTLLILDGLEVLQYSLDENRNTDIFNPHILDFLYRLCVRSFSGLCVVTTRYPPGNLKGQHISTKLLEHLSPADGRKLVVDRGVQVGFQDFRGRDVIDELVKEYRFHALALWMVASFLVVRQKGDPRKSYLIETIPETDEGGPARRVLLAYHKAFAAESRTAELFVIRVLALFDEPIQKTLIVQLRDQDIFGLSSKTQSQVDIDGAVENLRQYGLLSVVEQSLDLHPLVRAFFRESFCKDLPDTWTDAHGFLYELMLTKAPRCLADLEDRKGQNSEMNDEQTTAASGVMRCIRHSCLAERYWDGLATLVCRVDEAYTAKRESLIRALLRIWHHIGKHPMLEWMALQILKTAGRCGLPPFGQFYRSSSELHAPIGFYLGSRLQAWDLRFQMATNFYPNRDVRETPLLPDRLFASYIDLSTAYCCSALGYSAESCATALRAYENFRNLGLHPLAFTALTGLTILKIMTGAFREATNFADEAIRYAVTAQQRADSIGLLATVLSCQGSEFEADREYSRARALTGRLSSRVSQFFWEHAARYYSRAKAELTFHTAEQEAPPRDISRSDLNYRTVLILCRQDAEIRHAFCSGDKASIAVSLEQIADAYKDFPDYHFEGAGYRAHRQLQEAEVIVLNVLRDAQNKTDRDGAHASLAAAQRLAEAGNYEPFRLRVSLVRCRLMHANADNPQAQRLLQETKEKAATIGYGWLLSDIEALEESLVMPGQIVN